MTLLVKPTTADGANPVLTVTPESAGWEHVGFSVYRLEPGQTLSLNADSRERCLVPVVGAFSAQVDEQTFASVGGRQDLFSRELTSHLYVPEHASVELVAQTPLELAVCSAPGGLGLPARLITPEQQGQSVRGQGTNTRYINDILPDTQPASGLLVVEVYTPAGHWSSYPPHKHCVDNMPHESALEETYYHRIQPESGFAFQRVYTDDRRIDETMAVENGDCVMVPEGYHPVGAAHGYDIYYLNVMAGPKRVWKFKNDPQHEWMIG